MRQLTLLCLKEKFESMIRVGATFIVEVNHSTSVYWQTSLFLTINPTGKENLLLWRPYDILKNLAGALGRPGELLEDIMDGFSVYINYSNDDTQSDINGTTVNAGTYLVNQQSTLSIGIDNYERCMVARFHPILIYNFLNESGLFNMGLFYGSDRSNIKNGFSEKDDIESQGLMICTGDRETEELPVNERYYYFTQHFTEGDMLDTADLHNHPWMLQLRGVRDFETFMTSIQAKKLHYVEQGLMKNLYESSLTDFKALVTPGDDHGNKPNKLKIIDQSAEFDWPIKELGKVYFDVLPTFPGLYTFHHSLEKPDWPYDREKISPGYYFKNDKSKKKENERRLKGEEIGPKN